MSSRQRLTDQQRGQQAWEHISVVSGKKDDVKKKYRTMARQLTALVRSNGLLQTLAFIYAKSDPKSEDNKRNAEAQAAHLLLEYLRTELAPLIRNEQATSASTDKPMHENPLIARLLHQSSATLRQVTVETLAIARWLSRFAEAELPSEEEARVATEGNGAAHG